jgi:hypothetical protein
MRSRVRSACSPDVACSLIAAELDRPDAKGRGERLSIEFRQMENA